MAFSSRFIFEKLASQVLSHGGGVGGAGKGDGGGSENGDKGTVICEAAGDGGASSSGMADKCRDKCRSRGSRHGEPAADTKTFDGTGR